jgi:hypothetical protein
VHARSRALRRRFAAAAAALALAAGAAAQTTPAGGGLDTAADYIVRFVQYVRWPVEEGLTAWQVCIASPGAAGVEGYAGRSARGKPFAVRPVTARDPLADCQVLDLTTASAAERPLLLERARWLPVLAVGEGESFCSSGGTVCLRARDEGGGFEVNLSAAQAARLAVNAQLLMLGRKRHVAGGAR